MSSSISRKERLFIYTGLVVALGAGFGWRPGSERAIAQAPAAPTLRIATVDVLGIAEKLITTDKYRSARDTNTTAQNKMLAELENGLKDLQARIKALPNDSKDRDAMMAELEKKGDEYRRARDQAVGQVENFNTLQVAEAYKLVIEAAERLGTQKGYTIVIASRSGTPTIRSDNVAGAVQEMLARPVVKADAADDLTAELQKSMGLDTVAAPPQAPAGAAPEAPPAK